MADISDKELFEQAINDTPANDTPEPAPTAPEPEVDASGQPRDDKGRFAAKEQQADPAQPQPAEPQAEAQQPQPTDSRDAHVPSWRLREVNEARELAERRAQEASDRAAAVERQIAQLQQQLQQTQKPQEPVDPWQDLPGYLKQSEMTVEQRIAVAEQRANLRASRAEQIAINGREAVSEMEQAIEQAMRSGHPDMPWLAAQMRGSDDPVGVAMQWHQREKVVRETGGDMAAYRNKLSDDLLKDPAFLAKALEAAKAQASGQPPGSKPNTVVQLPPSINRQTAAGSPHDQPGDLSDSSLYAFATR